MGKYFSFFITSFILQIIFFKIIGLDNSVEVIYMIMFSILYTLLTFIIDKVFIKKRN